MWFSGRNDESVEDIRRRWETVRRVSNSRLKRRRVCLQANSVLKWSLNVGALPNSARSRLTKNYRFCSYLVSIELPWTPPGRFSSCELGQNIAGEQLDRFTKPTTALRARKQRIRSPRRVTALSTHRPELFVPPERYVKRSC